MATAQYSPSEPPLSTKRSQNLQEMLIEVGLSVEYWLPILKEHLGVTCAQALQHLEEKDLQKLKSHTQHPWEKKALEKLLTLSHTYSLSDLQESQDRATQKKQKQAEQALQELKELQSERQQQVKETMRKNPDLKQPLEITEEYRLPPQKPLKEFIGDVQRSPPPIEGTISQRQNLPDKELLTWASGGLALQGIYKSHHQSELIEKREKLLSVPKDFSLSGPEQHTRMETVEFTSSQAESMFTQTMEKLGFSLTASIKGGGWGFSLEAGREYNKHSESKESKRSCSEHSYFCSMKFQYTPMVSFHFSIDQLQFSKAALQELKYMEDLLDPNAGPHRFSSLRHRMENFFHRFGSHANQGTLHLGGIYWWKAVSEGFQQEQLAEVRQQSAQALDSYIRGGYSGFGVKVAGGMNVSDSHSNTDTEMRMFQNLRINMQLSMGHRGGPPEADDLVQWKAGLIASNQTWCVIDRGLELVSIWDIILSSHRTDFKNPIQLAHYLEECYTDLSRPSTLTLHRNELLSAEKEARIFLEDVKHWKISDPEEQLKELLNFRQMLSQKIKRYDIWINMCLTDYNLQDFLVSMVIFCKKSSKYQTKFIKSQLRSLLDPYIYSVTSFPEAHSIMQWIYQSEPEQEQINISQFSELIEILKEIQNELMEMKVKSESPEIVKESQRKATYEVSLALSSFLNYLQETDQPDTYLLLLSIAAGAGYEVNKTFQYLLGCDDLKFLLHEMQSAQDQYQRIKNISSYKAQAFMILTGLTATARVTISSEKKMQCLTLMKQHMGPSLSKEVAQVLTKLGADHDWENLEKDLRLLIAGDHEATVPSLQTEMRMQLQSLLDCKKQPHELQGSESNKPEVIENEAFRSLLQRLGLEHYYPKRMGRANFNLIYKTSVNNTHPSSEQELPFYFLEKLLMLDYGLRYLVFQDNGNTEHQVYSTASNQEKEVWNPYEDFVAASDNSTKLLTTETRSHIHPMDIQMAIFHCADDFARQYILTKLSICQFALPLVVPNPCTSHIEFSLWPFRQIRKIWQQKRRAQKEKKSYKNQQMCQVSTPIVSFVRVGNGLSASKSQIMNCLLSIRKHDVFFHRHCIGSSKDCLLMGGVIEICWFCPGGEEEDRFNNCVTFANLHGDAKEHRQQLTFLQEVSSLIVVLMSASDENTENRKIVHELCQSPRPLICLLDDREKTMARNSGQRVKIGIRNRNEAELTQELTTTIRRLLELSDTALSLEDCALIAHKQGFLIDENQNDCKETKEKAQTLMALLKETELSQVKENFLPLQGQLWHLCCKKDKELYHLRETGNQNIEQHKSEIEAAKRIIRHEQLTKAFTLNGLMGYFLQILLLYSETNTKLYFIQWLSMFMDNLTAEHLEKLREKQRHVWSLVQTKKKKVSKSSSLQSWQNEIEGISTEVSKCTLGIDQFLREVGQIYEALEDASSINDPLFLSLPQIAADLMISGAPIELMDGDVSYVPLKWVAAVFDKVSEKLGDKRLFVLSIVGLQSSGKSTLLNALFGLQFTFSAGRCTHGAYMQLLKVEKTFTEELGFDFVLVVNTEGLQSPELTNKSQNRDHELVTFVIGLGNLTLINIFGENLSEIQDILQIAVQAFVRMKQVKIFPSCFFVHQNVGEVIDKDRAMERLRCLELRLDEMAAIAAEQEQCSDITRFSDVIKFDVSTHVYYFAHLWDGNPPMAPPNPRYSHNVQELKNRILMTAKQEPRGGLMKISDVKFRVQDLWRALVNENFIFSFRNIQEVMAMSKLETKYNEWAWALRSHVLNLDTKISNQIQNGQIVALERSTLEAPVTEKYESIMQELEMYFNEDPDNEILIQCKADFENKLRNLKEGLISDSRRKANELISLRQSKKRLDKKKADYEKYILERSQKLALTMKDKEMSEEELYEIFNPFWMKWVFELSSNLSPVEEADIDRDSKNILWEYFQQEKNIVDKLHSNYGQKFEINYDKHVRMSKRFLIIERQLEARDRESIDRTTECIITRVNVTINNIQRQQRDYSPSDFLEILRIVDEEMKSASTEERYTLTRQYKIDLCLCLFKKAAEKFKEMHRAFKRANDPVHYLESKKDDFFMRFKISC